MKLVKPRQRRLTVMIVVMVALAGLGWWGWHKQRIAPAPIEMSTKPANVQLVGQQPVDVEAVAAIAVDMTDEATAVGNLRAKESVVMRPEVAGRIAFIGFRDGERVAAGALLVRLDDVLTAAEVAQAKAELSLSQANHRRTADLAQRNFVSGSALDQALANMTIQQAKLQLAEARQSRTRIRAPFAGVLGLRNVSVGDFVKEGDELVVLEDVSTMKVDLRLPERYAGALGKGQKLNVMVDAYPGREFPATLDALDVQIDASGRSVLVRGQLANPEGGLRSGMFAKARIVLATRPGAVMVPEEAVLPLDGTNYVYVVEQARVRRQAVLLGQRREGRVEIVGNVKAGAMVVTAGQPKIERDDQPVRLSAGVTGTPAVAGR